MVAVAAKFVSFSLSVKKSYAPAPRVLLASLIDSKTVSRNSCSLQLLCLHGQIKILSLLLDPPFGLGFDARHFRLLSQLSLVFDSALLISSWRRSDSSALARSSSAVRFASAFAQRYACALAGPDSPLDFGCAASVSSKVRC